ncbi:hypothetical protein Ocin01_06795 [Orchesella cincta]|uniref:Uncharacterized protein n=1 Tax=Orchesella cincta TaxID=48709 RepID=A0A1D2N3N1_ORCCI|nr:hypothetical protein Ocin01_06795 [Orchesella cincta]
MENNGNGIMVGSETGESSFHRTGGGSNSSTTETDTETPSKSDSANNESKTGQTRDAKGVLLLHEKRKAVNDEDGLQIQSKRKYQPTACDQHTKMDSKPLKYVAEKGVGGELPVDGSFSVGHPNLLFGVSSSSSEEVDELTEQDLETENRTDFENRFTWMFWTSLHANYGRYCGYAFGFLITLFLNISWMLDEIGSTSEGHSVSKTFVVVFILYAYSFITLGLELVQFVFLFSEIYLPYFTCKLREHLNDWDQRYPMFGRMRSAKYFYPALATLFCGFQAVVGSVIWNWFWWNHICKSYHDRTCKKSWLGQLVIAYRDNACFDGTASPIICEKFVSYLPIFLFGMGFVFLGNVLMPLLVNDRLSLSYLPGDSLDIDAALDILEEQSLLRELKNNDTKKDSTSPVKVGVGCMKRSLPKQFNFSQTVGKSKCMQLFEDVTSDVQSTATGTDEVVQTTEKLNQPGLPSAKLLLASHLKKISKAQPFGFISRRLAEVSYEAAFRIVTVPSRGVVKDYLSPSTAIMGLVRFSQLILNAMTVGCVTSLYLHRNRKCSWEKNLLDEKFTIFTYFFGVYFTFHVVTWFIIFSCFFHYFVQVGLKYLFLNSIRRMMFKNLASFLVEFAFGYWAAGEILGGWCDFEHFRECIQNTKVDECDSFFIKRIARFVQGVS